MPPRSPEPLRKVPINLFVRDCEDMARFYGYGWTERVREMVREHLKLKRSHVDFHHEPQEVIFDE